MERKWGDLILNILTPVSSAEEIQIYAKEGSDEFFAGYVNQEWLDTFNYLPERSGVMQLPLNRRTPLQANITSREELQKAVAMAKTVGGRLYITLNASFYTENMYTYLRKYLKELISTGVNYLIVSDIGIMELLNMEFSEIKITVSCVAQVISSSMVAFYKNFNVERIVFPRHISLASIGKIADQFPELEFECFGLCEKCMHDDGNCRCMHSVGAICLDCWNTTYERVDGNRLELEDGKELMVTEAAYQNWIAPNVRQQVSVPNLGCSLCSIGELLRHKNIHALKISGRGRGVDFVRCQISIVHNVIKLFSQNKSVKDVQGYVQQVLGTDHCMDHGYCIMRGS